MIGYEDLKLKCLCSIYHAYHHVTVEYVLHGMQKADLLVSQSLDDYPSPYVKAHCEAMGFTQDNDLDSMTITASGNVENINEFYALGESVCYLAADILLKYARSRDTYGHIDINDWRLERCRPMDAVTFERELKAITWEDSVKLEAVKALARQALDFITKLHERYK